MWARTLFDMLNGYIDDVGITKHWLVVGYWMSEAVGMVYSGRLGK
jgi:hypothetical protein